MATKKSHEFRANTQAGSLLTVGEAAQFLNLHPNTLREWSIRGLLPCYRVGPRRDRRFYRKDLEEFLTRPFPRLARAREAHVTSLANQGPHK